MEAGLQNQAFPVGEDAFPVAEAALRGGQGADLPRLIQEGSEKHAGFVVNRGGATCADVLELVRQVKEEVLRQTGVELEMEVKVLK